jgi:hypothetical protein
MSMSLRGFCRGCNDVTFFYLYAGWNLAQALTERQPQLEKTKALRARAPLSRKAVAALCVASFVAGLLLSGRVPLVPASAADAAGDGGAKQGVRVSGCGGNKRVSALSLGVAWLLFACSSRMQFRPPLHLIEL